MAEPVLLLNTLASQVCERGYHESCMGKFQVYPRTGNSRRPETWNICACRCHLREVVGAGEEEGR